MIHTSRHNGLQGFGGFAPSRAEPYFPSYQLQPYGAFGKTITIDTPFGPQKFNIPVEDLARSAAMAAVEAAWPAVQQKFYQELPVAVDRALNRAQPRVRKEVDRAVNMATSRAVMVATGLAMIMVGSAWWVRRAVKKGR